MQRMANIMVYCFWDFPRKGGSPVSGAGGLNRLRQAIGQLNTAERRVAEWILANPTQMSSLTVRELARHSQSSQSAVMRLCQRLQFKGYPDLKMQVLADIIRSETPTSFAFTEIKPDSPFHARLADLQQSLVSSIQMTLSGISIELLQTVSDLIHPEARILAFGSGASAVVAKDIQQKLQRLGYAVWAAEDFHTAAVLATQFGPKDLFFAVSYSGRTTDVIEVARIMDQQQVNVVAITQYGVSPLRDLATLVLPVNANEATTRVGATGSLAASLAVIDSVLLYHVNRYPESSAAQLQRTRKIVGSHRRSN